MDDGKIRDFNDLIAWKEAHKLVLAIYLHSKKLPNDERFGLISQMRRSAISITSNIAEGFARYGVKGKSQFYNFSLSSLAELQSQLITCRDLGYIKQDNFQNILQQSKDVRVLLCGLVRSVSSRKISN